jgi:hypothetical protein
MPRVRLRKAIYMLLTLIVVAICSLWAVRLWSIKPPKEATLIQEFQAHKAIYERLQNMLLEESRVNRVYVEDGIGTVDSPVVSKPSESDFPIERYEEYVRLLRQIDSSAAFKGGEASPEIVCMGAWGAGWAGNTRHIWICSSQRAPNQVASLDAYYRDPRRPRDVFRHIEGNWYLRADW